MDLASLGREIRGCEVHKFDYRMGAKNCLHTAERFTGGSIHFRFPPLGIRLPWTMRTRRAWKRHQLVHFSSANMTRAVLANADNRTLRPLPASRLIRREPYIIVVCAYRSGDLFSVGGTQREATTRRYFLSIARPQEGVVRSPDRMLQRGRLRLRCVIARVALLPSQKAHAAWTSLVVKSASQDRRVLNLCSTY
jgi:hypothetical protein